MKACKDCLFHVAGAKLEDGRKIGFCYRYPPQIYAANSSASPPVLSETTWCGEFKLKPKSKVRAKR